jgi:hypothetical protein
MIPVRFPGTLDRSIRVLFSEITIDMIDSFRKYSESFTRQTSQMCDIHRILNHEGSSVRGLTADFPDKKSMDILFPFYAMIADGCPHPVRDTRTAKETCVITF